MLRINNVKVNIDEQDYRKVLSQVLNVSKGKIHDITLVKQAVDARRKNHIYFNCAFTFAFEKEEMLLKNNKKLLLQKVEPYRYPKGKSKDKEVVVVGSGPAGLFCAYQLARSGQRVTLIERGSPVEQRKEDVDAFFAGKPLQLNSNIQFGEGGAGTFSDGKLTTGIKDKRKQFVLETFVKHGACNDILYRNKPHVGTDYLREVVKSMREYIIHHGGKVEFNTKLIDLNIKDSKMKSIVVERQNTTEVWPVDNLVLAIGHSARDTYTMLYHRGVTMVQKPFAVGFRIEHLQSFISVHQYGDLASHPALPVADYKLAVKSDNGRGVYTFCMCPGGQVVNASSEEKRLVVNGMSNYARDDCNANSAILVTVDEHDFKDRHPLAGMYFQQELEELAFALGGSDYGVPIQRVEDYLENHTVLASESPKPSVLPRVKYANLNFLFSKEINVALHDGLKKMNQKFSGFINNAILSGVETRSSAPVRIERDETMESNIKGLYPIGEGAGYAGGIMSSAIDGLKCAEIILKGE